MHVTLVELASFLDGEVTGEAQTAICELKPLEHAQQGALMCVAGEWHQLRWRNVPTCIASD